MAELTEPQHTILRSMRNRGLQDSAGMLQGLFEQIVDRPGDEQLIEKIGGMVKQYTDDTPVKPPETSGGVAPSYEEVPYLAGYTKVDAKVAEAEHGVGPVPDIEEPHLSGYLLPPDGNGSHYPVGHWDCSHCREALDSEKAAQLHICPVDLVPLEFVIAMGQVLRDGVKGPRTVDDWKDIRNTTVLTSKTVSLLRHVIRGQFAAAACNCLILWWAKEESNK